MSDDIEGMRRELGVSDEPEQLTLEGIIDDLAEQETPLTEYRATAVATFRVEALDADDARLRMKTRLEEADVIHPYSLHITEAP